MQQYIVLGAVGSYRDELISHKTSRLTVDMHTKVFKLGLLFAELSQSLMFFVNKMDQLVPLLDLNTKTTYFALSGGLT